MSSGEHQSQDGNNRPAPQRYPYSAPFVFINPSTPAIPVYPPGFESWYGTHARGPVLSPGYPDHGPSSFDEAASFFNFSPAESRSLCGGVPPSLTSQTEREWLKFSSQPWVHFGELEPMDERGRSILHEWLEHPRHHFYVCKVSVQGHPCGASLNRQDRALAHVRKHLNTQPFLCSGKCGNPVCPDSFISSAYLKAHMKPVSKLCQYCGREYLRQNVKRHEDNCRMRHEETYRMRK